MPSKQCRSHQIWSGQVSGVAARGVWGHVTCGNVMCDVYNVTFTLHLTGTILEAIYVLDEV